MSTEMVSDGVPVTPVTGTSTLMPLVLLSGMAWFGVAVKTLPVPPPPPPPGATDFEMSSLTLVTVTFGFEGEKRPVGDHRKSMWLFSVSVQ